jgi:hypothetical protein
MKNSQMKKNRFKIWAEARKKAKFIFDQVLAGKTVYLATATKITKITKKQLALVYATKSGLIIRHGKQELCYDYAKIWSE